MADVEISYNNSTIVSLNDSITEILETAGTFLDDDITVTYTKPGGGLKYETGSFTLTSNTTDKASVGNGIPHGLGVAPDVVIVWQETYDDSNVPTVQVNAGYVYLKRIMDMKQRLSSSATSSNSFYASFTIAANSTVGMAFTGPTSTSYMPGSSNQPSSTEFFLYKTGNSNYWRSGVAYKYFVAEKWW